MKEEAIKKINKVGRVSWVLALIGKIFVGMLIVLFLVGTVFLFAAPKDLVELDVSEGVDFRLNFSEIEGEYSKEELENLEKDIEESLEVNGEKLNREKITLVNDTIQVNDILESRTFDLRDLACIYLVLSIGLIVTMVTLCFISALCKAFRDCETPFEENVIVKMRNFAYSLIPWAIISSLSSTVFGSFLQNKLMINLNVDIGIVVIILIVFLLVHIFKYGAVLQQESDETL